MSYRPLRKEAWIKRLQTVTCNCKPHRHAPKCLADPVLLNGSDIPSTVVHQGRFIQWHKSRSQGSSGCRRTLSRTPSSSKGCRPLVLVRRGNSLSYYSNTNFQHVVIPIIPTDVRIISQSGVSMPLAGRRLLFTSIPTHNSTSCGSTSSGVRYVNARRPAILMHRVQRS